jgi:hypothetical protein
MAYIELLDPTGKPRPQEAALAPRPDLLKGWRIGLLDNAKPNADVLLDRVEEILRSQHGVGAFVRRRKETSTRGATFLPEFAGEVQLVVNALGD